MHEQPRIRTWTWADQVSSYRFWALLGAWLCVACNSHLLRSGVLQAAREQMGFVGIGQLMGLAMPLGVVTGVIWGMLVVRSHAVRGLIVVALLAGVALPFVTAGVSDVSLPILALNLVAAESLSYGFMVAVIAILAGSRSGSVAFAAVLALVFLLKAVVDMPAALALMHLNQQWPNIGAHIWGIAVVSAGVLLLAPLLNPAVRPLFSESPAARHRPLQPRYRHPWAAAVWGLLLWLGGLTVFGLLLYAQLWFFGAEEAMRPGWIRAALVIALVGLAGVVYWNYRIHGEIAALTPSPELLTPRAAAISCLLLPLGALLLPLQLATVLNQTQRVHISVAWLVCWSLLMPAIAMAQIQRAVNRLADAASVPSVLQGVH